MFAQESFNDVERVWLEEIQQYASGKVIRILVGNKCDLVDKRKVSTTEGKVGSFSI